MTSASLRKVGGIRCPSAVLLAAWFVVAAAPAQLAAQAPRPNLPVHIEADTAEMDDRSGIGIYSGNVVVTRGDITFHADRVMVFTEQRRPVRFEAEGRPARAEAPDAAGQPRVATARKVQYSIADEVLVLTDQARVQTATEDARGDRITYDMVRETVRAESATGQRVQITIQPRED